MMDKQFYLRCVYCAGETEIVIEIPLSTKSQEKNDKKIQITRYCDYCRRPNIIRVPESWDDRGNVLGDDEGVLGYANGIPILQGVTS